MTGFLQTQKKFPDITEREKLSWLQLIRTENIGPITFYNLIERFGSATKAIEHLPTLSKRGGRLKVKEPLPLHLAEDELEAVTKTGAQIICACEEAYPLALSAISDAPPVLTVRGKTKILNHQGIGIVGARNASLNARKFAETLAHDLGQAGQIVTSGFARGIDTAAHKGALATGTIAVVAGGVDVIYPEENKGLYTQIIENGGCVVAESPFGQIPYAQSFPKRNRIISGLSAGVVVIEASLRSGSLITARLAAEQGRDVFAVPGFPLDPRAQGPNKLIQDGAVLVQQAEDILNYINTFSRSLPKTFKEPANYSFDANDPLYEEDESIILDAQEILLSKLSTSPLQSDFVLRDTGLSPQGFNSALLELELAGRIGRAAGGKIFLIK